jgi:hypothetical protein
MPIYFALDNIELGMYQYQNSPKTFGSWVLGIGIWISFGFWGIWNLGSFGFG